MDDKRYVINIEDTKAFEWLLDNSVEFRQLKDSGEKTIGLFPLLLQDFFYALWLENPRIIPYGRTSCGARLNRLAVEQLMKNRDFKNTRSFTRSNLWGAAMAVMYFADLFLTGLHENIKEIADEIFSAEEELKRALVRTEMHQKIAHTAIDMAMSEKADEHRAHGREWQDQVDETKKRLKILGARLNMAWNTTARAKTAAAGAEGQGNKRGAWIRGDLTRSLKSADLFFNSPKLIKLAERLGKLKAASRQSIDRDPVEEASEVTGIEYGNDLTLVVPEEWTDYLDPIKKTGFKKKYVDEALCLYDYLGKRRRGRGSMVICFLCSAGTDFEKPLRESLRFLEQDKYPGGDIVFITDGACSVGDGFLRDYHARKKEMKFRTVVVIVNYGRVSTAQVEVFSDEILISRDLKGHDVAGNLLGRMRKG